MRRFMNIVAVTGKEPFGVMNIVAVTGIEP